MAKLRPPTLKERKAGLPKTKQEAINAGLTRFIPEDGKERVIRGYGSKLTPGGHVKMADSRKATSGNRRIAEDMITPDEATKKAADKSMANMRSRGNVGHHRFPVSYLAAGEKEKPGTIEAYKRVHGESNIGHTPQAIDEMSIPDHNRLHNVEEPAMWRSVKKAGSEADNIFGMFRKVVQSKAFRAVAPAIPLVGYGAGAAEATTYGMDYAKSGNPLDAVQSALATAGTVPAAGIIPDVINAGVSLYRAKGSHNRIRGRSGAQKALQGG